MNDANRRIDAADAAEVVGRMRAIRPLVQCLTNTVSANFVANALLAAGASPAMVDNPQEAAGFAAVADAVLINLGTPTLAQVEAMHLAAGAARAHGRPWVLDPVGVGGLPWRSEVAAALLARHHPAAIRGNASEIAGLAAAARLATTGAGPGRGVDATASPDAVAGPAAALLAQADAVSASGPVDHLFGAGRVLRIAGGDPLQTRVTAMGCALGAVAAAAIAAAGDALAGLAAAHVLFAVAAERAAAGADGPGSFAVRFLDALATTSPQMIARDGRLESERCRP